MGSYISKQPTPSYPVRQSVPLHSGSLATDYKSFTKKSLQLQTRPEVLEECLRILNEKEEQISKYKYHEDFDRWNMQDQERLPQQYLLEKTLSSAFMASIIITRLLTNFRFGYYSSLCLEKNTFMFTFPGVLFVLFLKQQLHYSNHIANETYFGQSTDEIKSYRGLDEHMNLYKDVHTIKNYDYAYPNIHAVKFNYLVDFKKYMDSEILKDVKERYRREKYGDLTLFEHQHQGHIQ